MTSPYFTLYFLILYGVLCFHEQMGINEPSEFIFDQQEGLEAKVLPVLARMFEGEAQQICHLLSGTPIFRDEKVFLSLQAADMFAWHARRYDEPEYSVEYAGLLPLITQNSAICTSLSSQHLKTMAEGFKSVGANRITKPIWNKLVEEINKLKDV
jgi:hypothetical protein